MPWTPPPPGRGNLEGEVKVASFAEVDIIGLITCERADVRSFSSKEIGFTLLTFRNYNVINFRFSFVFKQEERFFNLQFSSFVTNFVRTEIFCENSKYSFRNRNRFADPLATQ